MVGGLGPSCGFLLVWSLVPKQPPQVEEEEKEGRDTKNVLITQQRVIHLLHHTTSVV